MSLGKKSRKAVNALREFIYERDGGCVVAGSLWDMLKPCGGGLTIQHRVSRGMGGSALFDDPTFLVAMCAIHNQLETSWPEFAKACIRNGWKVPRWVPVSGRDVAQIPVLCEGEWYLLSGMRKVHIASPTAEQMIVDIYGGEFSHEEDAW